MTNVLREAVSALPEITTVNPASDYTVIDQVNPASVTGYSLKKTKVQNLPGSTSFTVPLGTDIQPGVISMSLLMPEYTTRGPFNFVGHSRSGTSIGHSEDQVAFGFNIGPNCYPLIPNQAANRFAMTGQINRTTDPTADFMLVGLNFFKPTPDIESVGCFEVNFNYNRVAPYSGANPLTSWNLNGDQINWINSSGDNSFLEVFSNGPGQVGAQFLYGIGSSDTYNLNGVPVCRQLNAAGNAFLNLPYIDSSNRCHVEPPAQFDSAVTVAGDVTIAEPGQFAQLFLTGNVASGALVNMGFPVNPNLVQLLCDNVAVSFDIFIAGASAIHVANGALVSFPHPTSSPSAPPANSSAAGIAGTVTWDANFIYVCVATNTWKRTAISTW